MLRPDQKIFGYAKNEDEWIEFDSWSLLKLNSESETEYRKWHSKYEKRIHINRDLDSPLIFFNRRNGTFSYFSEKDKINNPNSSPITLSHLLRQKIISERIEAVFSLRSLINKKNQKTTPVNIKYKKVLVEELITINGESIRPDITIEFDEPVELASKWNHKLYVEVVEKNETKGSKIALLEESGHGVIEIPYNEAFDIFKGRKFKEVTKKEVDDLQWKIRNFFKKEIWAYLIVDPTSYDYTKQRAESIYFKKYETLREKYIRLAQNQESQTNELKELGNRHNALIDEYHNKVSYIKELEQSSQKLVDTHRQVIDKVNIWNKKGFVYKLIKQFKLEL